MRAVTLPFSIAKPCKNPHVNATKFQNVNLIGCLAIQLTPPEPIKVTGKSVKLVRCSPHTFLSARKKDDRARIWRMRDPSAATLSQEVDVLFLRHVAASRACTTTPKCTPG